MRLRALVPIFVFAAGAATSSACGGNEAPPPATATTNPSTATSTVASASESASAATPTTIASAATAASSSASAAASAAEAPKTAAPGDVVGAVTLPGGKPGRGAIVYLEDGPREGKQGATAWVDNKRMNFLPYTSVVVVGGTVTFHNSDPFPHNIFSPDHARFDLGSVPMNGARAHKFEKAGGYTLLCNLHPGMIGYVFVSPSSVFAKADSNGKFKLADVPGGTWHVNAWAPRMKGTAQSVTINGNEVTLDFALTKE